MRGRAAGGREMPPETCGSERARNRRIPSPGPCGATLSRWERVVLRAAAGQETGDGDVLVERLPMQAEGADLHRLTLLRRGVQEAGNQASGTPRTRPSERSTHIMWSSKRTEFAKLDVRTEFVRTCKFPSYNHKDCSGDSASKPPQRPF